MKTLRNGKWRKLHGENKAVLMSIRPEWVKHIFIDKDKKYEVRKRAPLLRPPYKVYVYCTKGEPSVSIGAVQLNGYVCGEFTCTHNLETRPPWQDCTYGTCLTGKELESYSKGQSLIYMQIENPILYDSPIELPKFGVSRPPQNFQFVEELEK